jgi:hypothetical protein
MPTAKKHKISIERPVPLPQRQTGMLRLDPNDQDLRQRITDQVAKLDPEKEREILEWMEGLMDTKGWSPQE